jgi:hypothetical protein
MNFSRWALGGVVGGLIGAAVWAAVGYCFEVEVGWIAWLVGILVGLGVRIAAGPDAGTAAGWTAAAIALVSLVAGKYAAVELQVSRVAWADTFQVTPESPIAQIAAEIMEERQARGEVFPQPDPEAMKDFESLEQLFPPDIWQEARRRWERLGPEDQRQKLAQIEAEASQARDAFKGFVRREGFFASFSPYDFLWALLAVASAFKLASAPRAAA